MSANNAVIIFQGECHGQKKAMVCIVFRKGVRKGCSWNPKADLVH